MTSIKHQYLMSSIKHHHLMTSIRHHHLKTSAKHHHLMTSVNHHHLTTSIKHHHLMTRDSRHWITVQERHAYCSESNCSAIVVRLELAASATRELLKTISNTYTTHKQPLYSINKYKWQLTKKSSVHVSGRSSMPLLNFQTVSRCSKSIPSEQTDYNWHTIEQHMEQLKSIQLLKMYCITQSLSLSSVSDFSLVSKVRCLASWGSQVYPTLATTIIDWLIYFGLSLVCNVCIKHSRLSCNKNIIAITWAIT